MVINNFCLNMKMKQKRMHNKHLFQQLCHYLGNNNTICKFIEFSFTVFYSEIASEIYKGNSKKYNGKYRSEGFFIVYPLNNLYK